MSSLNAGSGAARVVTRPPMSFGEPFEVCQRRHLQPDWGREAAAYLEGD